MRPGTCTASRCRPAEATGAASPPPRPAARDVSGGAVASLLQAMIGANLLPARRVERDVRVLGRSGQPEDELARWLVDGYGPAFRTALVLLRNRADAEEAVQDAFLRAWRFRAAAKHTPPPPRPRPSGLSRSWTHARHSFSHGLESVVSASGGIGVFLLCSLVVLFILNVGWRLLRRRLV
jgi:hypothetical protein